MQIQSNMKFLPHTQKTIYPLNSSCVIIPFEVFHYWLGLVIIKGSFLVEYLYPEVSGNSLDGLILRKGDKHHADVGDFSKTPFTRSTDSAGYLVAGRSYTIATVGTTVWTALGAASNTIGVTFTATASGIVDATNLVVSRSYTILTAGDTIWTVFGAANNNVGTTFIATGPGTGTGTAIQGNGTALGIWIQKKIQVSD
jgi:hypothetical protein